LKQEQKETTNKAKSFLYFSNTKPKMRKQSKPNSKTKEANKENQWKYFWSFYVLESENKNKNNKEKKESETWIYKVPTNYDV
jgi:hypothetical protein